MCSPCSASVAFGAVSIVAGLTGTLSGSELSKLIGRWSKKAECWVCALSLLGAVPFIFFGLVIAQYGSCMSAAWVSGGDGWGSVALHKQPGMMMLFPSEAMVW